MEHAEDWRELYDERAAILEYDALLPRAVAEQQAFEATVIRWMNTIPAENLGGGCCSKCQKPVGKIGQDAVPVLAGGGGHIWLHHGCHTEWMKMRRREAVDALKAVGITPNARA